MHPSIQEMFEQAKQHQQAGRLAAAEELLRQILQQEPNHADALHLLGVVLYRSGRAEQAAEHIRRAIEADPSRGDFHSNLGLVLAESGRGQEAIAAFRRAVQLRPDLAQAWANLAVALENAHRSEDVIAAYREALRLSPQEAQWWFSLGIALGNTEQWEEAVAAFRHVLALMPDSAVAAFKLGNALCSSGQVEGAVAAYRQAVTIDPDLLPARDNLLITLFDLAEMQPAEILLQHIQWERQHARPLAGQIQPHDNDRSPQRRLRIGYVSPDFREHSVAFFLENLLAHHDPNQVEIFCYAQLPKPDQTTARFQQLAHHWQLTTGQSDAQVAELVRRDRIDILVDLAGHSSGNRLLVFARKPAPVQVTYCGYPGTTGLTTMDYRLTDAYADPPGQTDAFHTEQLVRLPRTFLCFRPSAAAPAVGPVPALASGRVTFGSFNHLAKITDPTVELWSQILRQVPGSRLLLKSWGLGDAAPQRQLLDRFAARGIGPDRLEMHAWIPSPGGHLELYHRVDIALDTHPYHGTTTTCEALWMGVPVVSLAGQHHASRVGVSLLSNVGLPQLIAEDAQGYVQIAVGLANDRSTLTELRIGLRERVADSPLMDAPAFARNVEAAYRQMWRRWCQDRT